MIQLSYDHDDTASSSSSCSRNIHLNITTKDAMTMTRSLSHRSWRRIKSILSLTSSLSLSLLMILLLIVNNQIITAFTSPIRRVAPTPKGTIRLLSPMNEESFPASSNINSDNLNDDESKSVKPNTNAWEALKLWKEEIVISEKMSSEYEKAKRRYEQAETKYDDAMNALQLWKEQHKGVADDPLNPVLLQLKKDLSEATNVLDKANNWLNDAERRLKDARAAAEKSPKRQKDDVSDDHTNALEILITQCTSQGVLNCTGDWDIDEWKEEHCGKLKDITMIANIVGFVSENYFVRKETLKILEIFKKERGEELLNNILGPRQFVLLGTPGVGKSCILALICFWIAIKHKRPVLLLRQVSSGAVDPALYLFKDFKYYKWDDPTFDFFRKLKPILKDCWKCFDGFLQDDITRNNFRNSFNILATSGQFKIKNEGVSIVTRCLVPFWTLADITSFGKDRGYSQENIDKRYFYSGGNLRDFLNDIDKARLAVSTTISEVKNRSHSEQLQSIYGQSSDDQIDRIRMKTVKDVNNSNSYVDPKDWIGCITSKYLMIQLAAFQEPNFFQYLRVVAQSLNNDGLEGIAFEGYFHSLVQEKKTLELKMIDYDNTDKRKSSTVQQVRNECTKEVKFEVTERSGLDQQDCWKTIEDWANNPSRKVDYWIPCDSNFQTIDAIAKYYNKTIDAIDNETKYEFWLLQVTKSTNHAMNKGIVLRLSTIFNHYKVRYIAIVPDKDTRDAFRLQPAVVHPDIADNLSYHVAYFEVADSTP